MARSKWGSDDPRRAALAERNRSTAQREAVSRFQKGKLSWNSGKVGVFSKEARQKISNSLHGNTRRKGTTMSAESRTKISKGSLAAWRDGTIDIAAFAAGRKSHVALNLPDCRCYGHKRADRRGLRHTEQSKQLMAESATKRMSNPEVRLALSKAAKAHAETNRSDCSCGAHRYPKSPTGLEIILVDLLKEFPEIVTQKKFGRFMVDVYLPPPYHLVFEADGAYWHQDIERDRERDAYLMERFSLPVVRLTEEDLYGACRPNH